MLELRTRTGQDWLVRVRACFDGFLQDHAACERKAQATAMSLISSYPDRIELVEAMTELAFEELDHFRRVYQFLRARGAQLAADNKSAYVAGLRAGLRSGSQHRLIDRLLLAGIIEARSCERLGLVARDLEPGPMQEFYRGLAICEAKHHAIFVRLAEQYEEPKLVQARLHELLELEAQALQAAPRSAAVHG